MPPKAAKPIAGKTEAAGSHAPKSNDVRPTQSATVRMFCHGLGDCFLITIPQEGPRDYAILIDCGIAMGTSGEQGLMKQVVETIAKLTKDPATGRGHVDLLAVTHEHRDHVSGFVQAEVELAQIQFDHVWVAWTENPADALANELRAKHAKEKAAFARAFRTAKTFRSSALDARKVKALAGVLAFYGAVSAAGGKLVDTAAAMAKATDLAKTKPPPYLMPGDVLRLPGAEPGGYAGAVRVFVLGPPHDGPTLRRINPGKNRETYDKKKAALGAFGMSWTWAAAMSGHASLSGVDNQVSDESDFERSMPFDRKWRLNLKELAEGTTADFFQDHYLSGEAQRRIDGDWLWTGAQQLALYMESYTNNTSLVLAFELPKSKRVLLFAGDAQVGNWLSWHDIEEFKSKDGQTLSTKAADLLANTVLYKVGHHGSHNATLREKGLELMSHPELVAMLPVESTAVDRLGYGEMPLGSLVEALRQRAEGRVLRLDERWQGGKCPGTWRQGMSLARLSPEAFQAGAGQRPVYIEYTITDE